MIYSLSCYFLLKFVTLIFFLDFMFNTIQSPTLTTNQTQHCNKPRNLKNLNRLVRKNLAMRHKTAAVACKTTARTLWNTWLLQKERQNIRIPPKATLESIQWEKNLHHNILCRKPLKIQWGEIKEYRTTKRWDHLLHESEQRKVEENPWIVAPPKSVNSFWSTVL